jgi:carbonic anhydrase
MQRVRSLNRNATATARKRAWAVGIEGCRSVIANRERLVNSAIDELVGNALTHEADFEGPRAVIPAKHVAIVTCMDSRIDIFRIFGLDSGEAHVLRNAGGLVTEDMLRSLVLSQRRLQTREVILMHHTNCGLHGTDESALRAEITADTGHAPSYAFGAFSDIDEAVRSAIERVREHPFLPHRDLVRGFVYEVESGHLREVVV